MEAAAAAGINLIPSNDFSYYDQMLDTAILLNVIPQRYQRLAFENPEETLFAMGRGYQGEKGDVTALPMKKWFTTNYHYLVPEIDSATDIKLNSTKPFDEFNEAKALGITTKPVLIGPYTFLKLARNPQAEELEYDKGLVNAVAAVYAEVVAKFAELGAEWIQIDEPYLVLDKEPGDVELFKSLYTKILPARDGKIKVLLNTYFGHIADVYETVNLLAFDGIGLDLNEGKDENLAAVEKFGVAESTTIFAGVVNGRNIWRNDYAVSLGLVDALKKVTDNVAVSTASSLLHVPFSTEGEDGLADDVRSFSPSPLKSSANCTTSRFSPTPARKTRSIRGIGSQPGALRRYPRRRRQERGGTSRSPDRLGLRAPAGTCRTSEGTAGGVEPAIAADHHHRILPANQGSARRTRQTAQGRNHQD